MFHFLDNTKKRIRGWALRHAEGPHAKFWLSVLSFSEASFFPIPPDVLLIAILLANKARKWLYYAFITSLFSVLGGVFGYAIGFFFFDVFGNWIISFYGLEKEFVWLKTVFNDTAFWAIFAAAFTPIPYKIFTITAGLFNINFMLFIIASILGRSIRFFAVAGILRIYGERVSKLLYKYFNIVTFVVFLLLIAVVYTFI